MTRDICCHVCKPLTSMANTLMSKRLFYILVISTVCTATASNHGKNKRMLLDDMDVEKAITSLQQEINGLKSKIQTLEARPDTSGTFVRWGRKTCPATDSQLVYKGYVGGNDYKNNGGGVNYLCLPEDPTWASYIDGVNDQTQWRAHVFGTEFEVQPDSARTMFGDPNMHNQDVPCAVCQSVRPNVLMIPARKDCYPGWTMEYSGYLMAMYHDWPAHSDYACVDSHPEYLAGGKSDLNGHVMYLVEGRCGSLACPPYVEGRELACVVCSK